MPLHTSQLTAYGERNRYAIAGWGQNCFLGGTRLWKKLSHTCGCEGCLCGSGASYSFNSHFVILCCYPDVNSCTADVDIRQHHEPRGILVVLGRESLVVPFFGDFQEVLCHSRRPTKFSNNVWFMFPLPCCIPVSIKRMTNDRYFMSTQWMCFSSDLCAI